VTVEFTEQLMAAYKDQQKLHRRYAYQVLCVSVCNSLIFIVTNGVLSIELDGFRSHSSWGFQGQDNIVLDGCQGYSKFCIHFHVFAVMG